ncbi:hypothetical protein M9H77_12081 [Catharanthus roseus]|uniref:Uncharacterized protein n=1 Tax=Catharanthus roseus TaxID=4058 RepID=A0ACC0BGH0_CATRO|nr:hypothetical protein M9H77_12081 [Catharanthus roseus]
MPKKGVDLWDEKIHGHAQSTRLTEEQLQQTEQFKKSDVPPRNMLRFFREQGVVCAVSSQKIYNVVAKIKRNWMQEKNTVEEVLHLSAERATSFSIEMVRTATYLVILSLHTRHQLQ